MRFSVSNLADIRPIGRLMPKIQFGGATKAFFHKGMESILWVFPGQKSARVLYGPKGNSVVIFQFH
jgi:hypothetical protein